jgi:hypothetical protein
MGIVELSAGDANPMELSAAKVCLLEISVKQNRLLELGVDQVRLLELGTNQIGPLELRAAEACPLEVGSAEVGPLELGVEKVRALEVGILKIRPLEVSSERICSLEVSETEARSPEVGVVQARPLEFGAHQQIRLPQIGGMKVQRFAEPGWRLPAGEYRQCCLDVRCPHLQLGHPLDRGVGGGLVVRSRRPGGVAADECGEHFSDRGSILRGVVGDALQCVDAAQPHVSFGVAQLINGAGEPLGPAPLGWSRAGGR